MIEKIKSILLNPMEHFSKTPTPEFKDAFKYIAILLAIYTVLTMLLGFITRLFMGVIAGGLGGENVSSSFLGAIGLLFIPLQYIVGLGLLFVSAFVIKVGLAITGVKMSYNDSFGTMTDAITPTYVYGWIPIIGALGSIHSIVLTVIGFSKRLKIGYGKSFIGSVLIPFIFVMLVVIVFAALFFGLIFGTGLVSWSDLLNI